MKTKLMTVKIRRTAGLVVKPEAEAVDGKTFAFQTGWDISSEDSSIYVGETAMIPWGGNYPVDAPAWIASGDLIPAEEALA